MKRWQALIQKLSKRRCTLFVRKNQIFILKESAIMFQVKSLRECSFHKFGNYHWYHWHVFLIAVVYLIKPIKPYILPSRTQDPERRQTRIHCQINPWHAWDTEKSPGKLKEKKLSLQCWFIKLSSSKLFCAMHTAYSLLIEVLPGTHKFLCIFQDQ